MKPLPRTLSMRVGAVAAALGLGVVVLTLGLDRRAEREFARRAARGPFAERFVDADGVRWRYLEAGDGPPLVCLHGAYGGAEDWVATLGPELVGRFRVLAFDRPGHGSSGRADGRRHATPLGQARGLVAALDALGVERPLVAGFSFGGAVAAALVAEFPERARGALLVGAPLAPWDGRAALVDRLLATPALGPLLAHLGASALARLLAPAMLEEAFAPERPPTTYLERSPVALALRADALVANSIDLAGLNRALAQQRPLHARIAVPVELLHGAADQVVWASHHALPFAAEHPGAEVTLVDGAGHQLLYTRPAEVLAALERLLRRVDPDGEPAR